MKPFKISRAAALAASAFSLLTIVACVTAPRSKRLFVSPSDYIASDRDVRITLIDVGQGDCIFIKTPNRRYVLIDAGGIPSWRGGGDTGADYVIPFLEKNMPPGAALDAVIMTHPHSDHIGGMVSVLRYMKIKHVYDSGYDRGDHEYVQCLETIRKKKISYTTVVDGDTIDIDPDVTLRFFSPPPGFFFEGANNNSVVVRLEYKDFSAIFTGDIEAEAENYIVSKHRKEISANILKAPHHGSRTSSTAGFVAAVRPEVVLIPCGKNNQFGHPHAESLSRYRGFDAYAYRSDYDGNVTVVSNGFSFTVHSSRR